MSNHILPQQLYLSFHLIHFLKLYVKEQPASKVLVCGGCIKFKSGRILRPDLNTDSLVLGAKVSDEISQNSLLFEFYREGVNINGQK